MLIGMRCARLVEGYVSWVEEAAERIPSKYLRRLEPSGIFDGLNAGLKAGTAQSHHSAIIELPTHR